ncbi:MULTISPECIES: hypothetical protein [unclassified Streptomyces]|uniref:hypothetical protein n=1 Tax=unclassified Streptomyces TaxID=2593676 RepID=UPI0020304850|nr:MULTISPECIES: hypothetical protein [unclassified Streptomyces]MCM1969783.1 hypothetical protein [Streptomyces sp. G1]MCX5129849.1 hypothetical protein [Streptomyces sp. NBC_00347]MCX5300469.1 hypothetical protein [Streptomyces sp. NBC_00193]
MGDLMHGFVHTAARTIGVAGLAVASVMAGTNAQAASGGGCGTYYAGTGGQYVKIKACISSPGWGVGRPDAYISLAAGHPACNIAIRTVRTGNSQVVSNKVYPCPSGAINDKHFTAPDFSDTTAETGEAYANYTQINWTSSGTWTLPYRSPWLKLP